MAIELDCVGWTLDAPATGALIIVVTSVAESARLKMRTSSMRPLKYSPQGALPPMRSGCAVAAMLPVRATLPTSAPFT